MSKPLKTFYIRLQDGPHDQQSYRIEGLEVPCVLLFGELYDPENKDVISAYAVRAHSPSQDWNYFIADFVGQCNSQLLPDFVSPKFEDGGIFEDPL